MALRKKDATDKKVWCPKGKGGSTDSGIGSKALSALQDIPEAKREALVGAVDKVSKGLKDFGDSEVRFIGLALASDFSTETIIERAKVAPTGAKKATLGEREEKRFEAIAAEAGNKQMTLDEFKRLYLEAKVTTAEKRK